MHGGGPGGFAPTSRRTVNRHGCGWELDDMEDDRTELPRPVRVGGPPVAAQDRCVGGDRRQGGGAPDLDRSRDFVDTLHADAVEITHHRLAR